MHLDEALGLLTNIIDLHLHQLRGARPKREGSPRIVGVHVDAYELPVADDDDGVAQAHHAPPDRLDIQPAPADQQLRAVSIERALGLVPGPGCCQPISLDRLGSRRALKRLAPNMAQHAFEQYAEAQPTRIYDTRLAQNRQQRGRPLDARFRSLDSRLEQGIEINVAVGRRDSFGHLAYYSENRALCRLRYRLVCSGGSEFQSRGKAPGRHICRPVHAMGEPADDLREDNA